MRWGLFENLLFQNHWTNFNQTWHRLSLEGGNSSLFKKGIVLLQGEIIAKE
jgi:hypothetical protein